MFLVHLPIHLCQPGLKVHKVYETSHEKKRPPCNIDTFLRVLKNFVLKNHSLISPSKKKIFFTVRWLSNRLDEIQCYVRCRRTYVIDFWLRLEKKSECSNCKNCLLSWDLFVCKQDLSCLDSVQKNVPLYFFILFDYN